MSETTAHDAIAQALETLEEAKSEPTGGKWLERLTAQIAPYIKEWDVSDCWIWAEWPDRERLLPETNNQDNGIDAVAIDSSGALIAIQCKSRQLDENGRGNDIDRPEITSFIDQLHSGKRKRTVHPKMAGHQRRQPAQRQGRADQLSAHQENQAFQPSRRPHGTGARKYQRRGVPPLPAQPRWRVA